MFHDGAKSFVCLKSCLYMFLNEIETNGLFSCCSGSTSLSINPRILLPQYLINNLEKNEAKKLSRRNQCNSFDKRPISSLEKSKYLSRRTIVCNIRQN